MAYIPDLESSATGGVLVVDDDPATRLLIRRTLERAGFGVHEAGDGVAALAEFETCQPRLVVLDVRMPILDGYAACRRLRQLPTGRHVPIIMLTGLDDAASVAGAFDAGATDFSTKPIQPLLLVQRIRHLLHAHATDTALRESLERIDEVQRVAGLGYWEWWPATKRFICSERACEIFGCDAASECSIDEWLLRVHASDHADLLGMLTRAAEQRRDGNIVFRLAHNTGAERIIQQHVRVRERAADDPIRIIGTVQDITARQEAETRIRQLSYYDDTTGLPNRKLIEQHIEQIIEQRNPARSILAVLCISVDHCKHIYDTFGRDAGDGYLRTLAARLTANGARGKPARRYCPPHVVRHAMHLGHLGGGEFALILDPLDSHEDILGAARGILDALAEPVCIEDYEIRAQTRIGVSIHPHDGGRAEALLGFAITAMHHATSDPPSGACQFYSRSMNENAMRRLALESELRQALKKNQLELHFQPKVRVSDGAALGVEALVRWRHPERGLVAPAEFIPVAEESGLIVAIGDWVLKAACRHAAAWNQMGLSPLSVAVNLSAVQFSSPGMVDSVRAALSAAGLAAGDLELELTESTVMEDVETSLEILATLKDLGVRLSIDDFGTGYSSMSYLKQFPIDILKIDQSFVSEVVTDASNAAIVTAITAMAHELRLAVVAEGVETRAQFELLRDLGCEEVQGYLFGRPMPEQQFLEWFADRNGLSISTMDAGDTAGRLHAETWPGAYGANAATGESSLAGRR